jgi:hypothetical protein
MRIRRSSVTADLEATDRPLGGRRTAAIQKFFTILQVAELLEVSTRGSSGRPVDREGANISEAADPHHCRFCRRWREWRAAT